MPFFIYIDLFHLRFLTWCIDHRKAPQGSVWSGPVHTNPFSNENGAVLLRIRLSSTQQRRKRSPKTESFEIARQSGAIWKRYFLKTRFSSVDGENDAIWKRWRHPNRHDRAPSHSTVSIQNGEQTVPCGFSLDNHCSVDGRKRYENDKCGLASLFENGAKQLHFRFRLVCYFLQAYP